MQIYYKSYKHDFLKFVLLNFNVLKKRSRSGNVITWNLSDDLVEAVKYTYMFQTAHVIKIMLLMRLWLCDCDRTESNYTKP